MLAPRCAVPLTLDPAALNRFDPQAAVTALAGGTMGTTWHVRLVIPAGLDPTALQHRIEARLAALVAEMSHWEPASLLSRFNRAPAGSWTRLPSDFARVIATAIDIARRSGGAFDPTIGELVNLWGFGPIPHRQTPDNGEIKHALRRSGWRHLVFERKGAMLRQPGGLLLDLSGIAKGYAVDAVTSMLQQIGIKHMLIEIGGECAGRGMRPDLDPWWVELETPPGAALTPLRVALHGLAVATSGDYVRGFHTIDPRTGHPITESAAVSVLHESAMVADAWASALIVLGPEQAKAVALHENLAVRYVHASFWQGEWLSPMLAEML